MANPIKETACYFCGKPVQPGDFGANVTVVSTKKFRRKHYHLCEQCFEEEIVPVMNSREFVSDEAVPVLQDADPVR